MTNARRRKKGSSKVRVVVPEDAPPPPQDLDGVAAWLRWVTESVVTGVIDARTAAEATRALKELRPTYERLDVEHRVKELEAQLAEAKRATQQRRPRLA